jgi:hypothetical protein
MSRPVFSSVVAVGLLGWLAAGCFETPTAPTPQPTVLLARLSAANEVPPVTGPEAGGTGSATISFTRTADGYTVDIAVTVSGLPATSVVVGGHIHEGGPTVNGPVRVPTNLSPALPLLVPTGSASLTFTGIAVTTALGDAILATPGSFYFNLHSVLNPGGVMRGQLARP